ncbi:6-phosphofructokinase [Endozoicomonas montiporae]|uniref:ATP-dependent 6-phosphofructokinase n=2 Tax=Endozoicomonas montiporae TaxID=1027273 RepID=A0A081N505_9GAMM|nr:6-phosphofructokinase [Endozoicomonas montiporae CL-33]KEQ13528.1 6-phosphofructokinase [Endozoicomonas montiporae]
MAEMKKIGVLTSGGDAPGMNAAIRSVVRSCIYYGVQPVAIHEGYKGLIENNMEEVNARSVANIINQGGTFLKSARCAEFRTPEGRTKAFENAKAAGLDGLVVIGGDGSFTGAMLIEKEHGMPCIGVPGTIDNDIFGTDYTIGYDTALNTAVEAIDKIRDTATSHNRLFLIEVMGRDAGFIALNSGIAAGAEEILIPEEDHSVDKLMDSLQNSGRAGKTSSIVVVSEGEKIGGVVELGRAVEESFPEYEVKVTVLGHIQRGGKPTCVDRVLASRLGVAAVEKLREGISGVMVGVRDQKVVTTPLEEAISKHNAIDDDLLRVADIVTV